MTDPKSQAAKPPTMTAPQAGASLVAGAGATPPTAPTEGTTLDAPAPKTKLVKIRANQAIAYGDVSLAEGQTAEVSEEMAKEFCDRKFEGNYAFGGERSEATSDRHVLVRAVRV